MSIASSRYISTLRPPRAKPRRGARVAVLLNANARDVTRRAIETIEGALPDAELFLSRSEEEARRHVAEILARGHDPVLSGGGDGSAVALLNLLREASGAPFPRLGLLKLGTGNGWAGALGARGLEATLARFRDDFAAGRLATERFDLLEVETGDPAARWRLAHFAGFGWDARILNDFNDFWRGSAGLSLALRKSLGGYLVALLTRSWPKESLAYMTAGRAEVEVRAVSGEAFRIDPAGIPRPIDVRKDPILYRGPITVTGCATTEHFGFGFRAHPFARARPRFMSFRAINMAVPSALARLPSLWRGTIRDPRIHDFLAEHVRFEFSRPMPFQLGGDACGERTALAMRVAEPRVDVLRWM
jgi:diacylglycerol kinase family enzyme